MDTSEIIIKLADVIRKSKADDLHSDLIKIGIPSIVALVGTICSAVIGFKSYQKDLILASLNAKKESEQSNAKLKAEIIKDVSLELSEVHAVAVKYSSLFASKIDLLSDNAVLPNSLIEQLRDSHQQLLDSLHNIYTTESKILLLGESDVISTFRDFHQSLTGLCYEFGPFDSTTYDNFNQYVLDIQFKKENVFKKLSPLYFSVPAKA